MNVDDINIFSPESTEEEDKVLFGERLADSLLKHLTPEHTVGNVWRTFGGAGRDLAQGVLDFAHDTSSLLPTGMQAGWIYDSNNLFGDDSHGKFFTGQEYLDKIEQIKQIKGIESGSAFRLPTVESPTYPGGDFVRDITQFAVPFSKLKYLTPTPTTIGSRVAETISRGAITDLIAFSPNEERLSNLIESYPALQNPVTEFLEADPTDTLAEARFKQAVEGVALGGIFDTVLETVQGIRSLKRSKQATLDKYVLDRLPQPIIREEGIASLTTEKGATQGISVLPVTKKAIDKEIKDLATTDELFVSPTLKALLQSAPRNLKGQQLINWIKGNTTKGVKPKEVEILDLENYIKENPNQNVLDVVKGVKHNQVKVSQNVYAAGNRPTVRFDVSTPDTDPLDGSSLSSSWAEDIKHELTQPDTDYLKQELADHYFATRITSLKVIPGKTDAKFTYNDMLDEINKAQEKGSYATLDDVIDELALSRYMEDPYELVKPVSTDTMYGVDIGDETFAFGSEETGYQLFVDGVRVTDSDNIAYSRTEAEIQLRNAMEEGGDPLRIEGMEEDEWFGGGFRYKQHVDESLPGGENYREIVFRYDNAPVMHDVTGHFPDEDAIAHALVRDRKLADGTSSSHVDELQSDVHSDGAKYGYNNAETIKKLHSDYIKGFNEFKLAYAPLEKNIRKTLNKMIKEHPHDKGPQTLLKLFNEMNDEILAQGNIDGDVARSYQKLINFIYHNNLDLDQGQALQVKVLQVAENRLSKINLVPDYPYKEDYHVMVLKQLIRNAINEGKTAFSVSGSTPIRLRYSDQYRIFYETLYDKKIPSAMKKLANKYGGKFEEGRLDADDLFGMADDIPEIADANIIHITPEMKEKILKEGFESFKYGGPVNKNYSILDNINIFAP